MTHPNEIHQISWQDVTIEIRYCKAWLSEDASGYNTAHLEIEAIEPKRARLPLSETGYKSHFCQHAEILQHGGSVAYVTAWLDHDAQSRDWQAYFENSKQTDLFDLL